LALLEKIVLKPDPRQQQLRIDMLAFKNSHMYR
jgi:hypothetical protein